MDVDATVRRSRLLSAFALCLLASACGSTTDVTLPEAVTTSESAADDAAVDESSTGDSVITDDSDSGDETNETDSPPMGEFAAPVRFENGEHESDSIDADLVEEKLAEAALAAFGNWRTCVGIGKNCNFQRDVAPLLSATQRVFKGQDLDSYREGERVMPGPLDDVVVVEVEALSLEPPILGQVSLCVVDSGVQMIEAGPGREEEIIDDSAIAYIVVYQLTSDADGVVTVEGEWYPEPFTEDLTLCDEYSSQ
jgi:hypothetical protein